MSTPVIPGFTLSDLPDDAFLTVTEVASALRVSKMTVYRLLGADEMPYARVGRGFRIPVKAVRAYLNL